MPYIPTPDRLEFDAALRALNAVVSVRGLSGGELNYLITKLGLLYLNRHGVSYNTLSDVVKAMECAKLEFYARHVRPYEDTKILTNGDVNETL